MNLRILLALCLLCVTGPFTLAQSDELLAFLNGSGQLVASNGDGTTRWIATNPGQVLDPNYGFGWDNTGELLFVLEGFGGVKGNPNTQAMEQLDLATVEAGAFLRGIRQRPHMAQPDGFSADGQYAFVWNEGRYFVVDVATNNAVSMRLVGNNNATGSGLWADSASLVAYWGLDSEVNQSAMAVFDPTTASDIVLRSGGSIPIPPIDWQPNTTNLIYRDGTGTVRIADIACVTTGCAANPLDAGILIAPASANHIQVTADHVYYVDSAQVFAVELTCVTNNTCEESRVVLGTNVAPLSMMDVKNNRLSYTSYANDPGDAIDRAVQLVDLTCAPDCPSQAVLNGAVAGLLSPSGAYLMVDIVGEGLNILSIDNGSLVYLTDTMGGQLGAGLTTAMWR